MADDSDDQDTVEDEESKGEDVPETGLSKIYALIHLSPVNESPINIHLANTTKIELSPLFWSGMNSPPKKVKLANTGFTVNYTVVYGAQEDFPCISGGPLVGDYKFAQLHFHWDSHNQAGSEHWISGEPQILEMHAVFFKGIYSTQEYALTKKDGIAIIAYIFRLQDEINEPVQDLLERLPEIREPHATIRMENNPLEKLLPQFENDYFLYIGSVNTATSIHYAHWLICRVPLGIALEQVETFRSLIGANGEPLLKNCRQLQPTGGRIVYHVNPSGQNHRTLLIMQKSTDKNLQRAHGNSKYGSSSCEYKIG